MKSYTASTIFFIALFAAPPAVWANTIINGTMLEGSLETQWITDYGPQASQSFHPTVGSPGDGATNPSIADSSNLFANETVAVSLGPLHGTSGAVTVFVPGGDITGKLWHLRTVFETPFGIGMGEHFFATIYVSGASSNMLYYGMRVSGSVTGGAVATFTTVSPPDSPDIVVTDSNFSFDQFGSSHLFTWLGDTPDYSTDGNGFVGFNFQANNSGLSAGTPRTTYDVWLQLSNTPLTTMTSVPEPGEWALLLMGGLALLGPMRRRGRAFSPAAGAGR